VIIGICKSGDSGADHQQNRCYLLTHGHTPEGAVAADNCQDACCVALELRSSSLHACCLRTVRISWRGQECQAPYLLLCYTSSCYTPFMHTVRSASDKSRGWHSPATTLLLHTAYIIVIPDSGIGRLHAVSSGLDHDESYLVSSGQACHHADLLWRSRADCCRWVDAGCCSGNAQN
jgi:hypothetical protein